MRKITSLLLLLFFLNVKAGFATTADLEKAWDAFFANSRGPAVFSLFELAAADPESKAEASLGMSLLSRDNGNEADAFRYFTEFYKASKDPFPYAFALWTTPCVNGNYNKKSKEQLTLLKMMAEDPRANQCMQALANSMLGYHFQRCNDFKQAKLYFDKVAVVPFAQVTGQFENVSGSGFNKDFGVLGNPESSAVFKNKVGADVKWFNVKFPRNDKWLDFAFSFNSDDAVCYAQSFVNSPADQEVILRAGASGAIKIWVNDKLQISVSEEKNTDIDIYGCKIKLNKGFNRILVQVGKSEISRANIIVRLFDLNDKNLSNISYSAKAEPYVKDISSALKEFPFFAETFFAGKIKADPTSIISLILLGEVHLRNDNVYEARKAFTKAASLAPGSTYIKERLTECYARDQNTTSLTKTVESIKALDPQSYYAIREFYNDALEKEDYDEAERMVAALEKYYGKNLLTEVLRLEIFKRQKKYDNIISLGNKLYETHSDNWDIVFLKYTIETSVNTDYKKANKVLIKYLKENNNETAGNILANNYFKDGAVQKGLDIYLKRSEEYPYGTGYYETLSELYFSRQEYPASEKWLKQILEICPYNGYYWNQLGKVYEAMNKTEDAKMAFAKCIYYAPTNYEAHRLLRKMQEKKELFDYFPLTDVNKIFANSPGAKNFPEDNSMILLNEMQRIVYPEGASEQRTDLLIKVFNQAGIDAWKEYGLNFNQFTQRLIIEKAEVFKADGNKVKAETNGAQIVFTTLEAGDAIHITYRLEEYVFGQMASHFSDRFNLNYSLPVGLCKYSLIFPSEKKFNYKVLNTDLQPVESTPESGYKMLRFEKSNLMAVKNEPYMPTLDDVGMVIDVSSIPDWKFVGNWYADLANTKAKADYEVKEAVKDVFEGKPDSLTQLEKTKLIYDYIEKNISYSSVPFLHSAFIPQKASRTLNTKLGDCKDVSTLFVAMCKEVGVSAVLVLVSTRDNGDNYLAQPTVGFNHCIAYVVADDQGYYIELTDNRLSFSTLSNVLIKAQVLQIPNETMAVAEDIYQLDAYHRVPSVISRNVKLSFVGSDMLVTRKTVCTGVYAAGTRYEYAELGTEEQLKMMSRAIGGDFSTPVKLNSLSFSDLKPLSDTVSYTLGFSVSNAVMDVAGMKIIKLPWSEAYATLDFLSLEKRNYPFNIYSFTALEDAREELIIVFPKGKALVEMPKSLTIKSDLIDYELTFKMSGTNLVATRSLKFNKEIVSPAEYPAFKEAFTKISEADGKQVAFK